MKATSSIPAKIMDLQALQAQVLRWKFAGKKIVFANGVFDLLHHGHLASLTEAATYGDKLIVAVNADSSVKKLKGDSRPIIEEADRAMLLANLLIVDAVIIFDEETPLDLIENLLPDALVKGGDYTVEQIAGATAVLANGGEVILAKIVDGISTTNIIKKMNEGI